MIKVLIIRELTTSLVLNNWLLFNYCILALVLGSDFFSCLFVSHDTADMFNMKK